MDPAKWNTFAQYLQELIREIVHEEVQTAVDGKVIESPQPQLQRYSQQPPPIQSPFWVETQQEDIGRCRAMDLRSRRCTRPLGHSEQRHRFVTENSSKGVPKPERKSWEDRPGLQFEQELDVDGRKIKPGEKIRVDGALWTFERLAYDVDEPGWERVMVLGRKRGFDLSKVVIKPAK